jgi:UDP-GlcNAc:undecaprenyl-phosphate/decaprenyl-phosphate GlcNAc-1-phosphate transferase
VDRLPEYNDHSLSNLIPAAQVAAWPFLFAFAVSLAMVPLARRLAIHFGWVDNPREDRWHRRPIARLGGAAIGATVLAGLAVFGGFRQNPVLLGCAGIIFGTGLVDDIFSLKPSTKLVIEIAVASIFLYFRFRLNWTHSLTLDMLLTLVWVVGMTNAFNLLDNMDGLCAGLALIVGGALLIDLVPAAPGTMAFFHAQYLALLLGAAAGFLVYNFHPASIFMGDSGSLLLGLSFAAITLTYGDRVAAKSNSLSIVVAPVLLLLIPIFDTTLVTVSRLLSGRAPSEGGRDHSSHRLVAIGLSERAAVALLWLLAAVGGALGIAVDYFHPSWSGLIASLFVLGMVIFAVYLAGVRVYEARDPNALDRSRLTPLVANFMYKARIAEVLLDLCLVAIAYYAAYRLRFEGADFTVNFTAFYRSLPLVIAAQMLALFGVGIYRGVWRYFGMSDAIVVVKGVILGVVGAQLEILYLIRFEGYSRTVFAIYAILLAILLTASRGSFRLIGEFLQRNRNAATRVVVYGAGDGGSLVVRELLKSPDMRYRVLGFVDDDPRKLRMRVHGYPVLGGYDSLASLVSGGVVDAVVVSARMIDVKRLGDLERLCAAHDVSLSRLHVGLEPLTGGSAPTATTPAAETPASRIRQSAS